MFLRSYNEQRYYKREGYTALDYMGDLGGLLDVLMVLGSIATSIFASKLFSAELISHNYRIQEYMKDTSQFYETTELYKLTEEENEAKN